MDITVNFKPTANLVTKSKLPASDFTVNPYGGCPHKCRYCYASFMKRFAGHTEPWGGYLDVKQAPAIKNPAQYAGKKVFFSSVTDCYNSYEAEYGKTREALQQFVGSGALVSISTKSSLILRDMDILTQLEGLTVSFSINTVDEAFRADMDNASPIAERLEAMRKLRAAGIHTVCFISPIFPGITDVKAIVRASKGFCDEYWLENLNLRGAYKADILAYIKEKYPSLTPLYDQIYNKKDKGYWRQLAIELEQYAEQEDLHMINYFYHEEIRTK